MGTSNISGIGKVFAGGQMVNGGGQVQDDDVKVAFTEVMSQMSTMVSSGFNSDDQGMDLGQNSVKTQGIADREYDRYQRQEMSVRESSKKDWSESDRVSEKMDQYAEDVKGVLKEELGVSEEQIEEAMETLGLSYGDLMNPNQLAALVVELTGAENASALLCNSEFLTVLQSVGALTENLLKELGLTADELAQMLSEAQSMTEELIGQDVNADVNTLDTTVDSESAGASEISAEANMAASAEQADALENAGVTAEKQVSEADDAQTDAVTVEDDVVKNMDEEAGSMSGEEADEKMDNGTGKDNVDNGTGKDNVTFSQSGASGNLHAQAGAGEVVGMNQQVSDMALVQGQDNANGFASQLDVANIIKQIVEYSRVTIDNSATTMEMQLNPENLGKLYLEITAKDGVVSAHITAQNEAVKEVLESQIVELRQNMNQAGIKVEAVEVAVGSHEFEKNLEQNAKQEEKQAEEQEKAAKQTRRINLNDLDELSGIMSEEESLVAQMMADQGNSVDFTA